MSLTGRIHQLLTYSCDDTFPVAKRILPEEPYGWIPRRVLTMEL